MDLLWVRKIRLPIVCCFLKFRWPKQLTPLKPSKTSSSTSSTLTPSSTWWISIFGADDNIFPFVPAKILNLSNCPLSGVVELPLKLEFPVKLSSLLHEAGWWSGHDFRWKWHDDDNDGDISWLESLLVWERFNEAELKEEESKSDWARIQSNQRWKR